MFINNVCLRNMCIWKSCGGDSLLLLNVDIALTSDNINVVRGFRYIGDALPWNNSEFGEYMHVMCLKLTTEKD